MLDCNCKTIIRSQLKMVTNYIPSVFGCVDVDKKIGACISEYFGF